MARTISDVGRHSSLSDCKLKSKVRHQTEQQKTTELTTKVLSWPGKSTGDPYIESFHGIFRDEFMNVHWFLSLEDAKKKIEIWREGYNTIRPHSYLVDMTTEMFIERQVETAEFSTLEHS
ncbi:integrase core domain-containing protein [Sphingobacterium siyangense]|uniref:integrase core domain-containing protein n=1 Tax=Sphingobacterium siyangense TaxID=459529 RepID=UPI003917D17B